MRVRINNNKDLWLFVGAVTVLSVLISEFILLGFYLVFGSAAFSASHAFYVAFIVPVLVAIPISYLTAGMALKLNRAHAQLKELAHTDELTGLINRRSFFEGADQLLARAQAESSHLSLLVIDADYFKQLNDTYGHATGDAALQFITERLTECVRSSDLLCRLGGEEFAVLVPGRQSEGASRLAERILERVATRPMVRDNAIIEMSVSCGIADTEVGYDMTTLFKAADDALYAAKHSGRNRLVLHSGSTRPASSPATSLPAAT